MVGGNNFNNGAKGFFLKAIEKRCAADSVVNTCPSTLQYFLKGRTVLAEIMKQPAQFRWDFCSKRLSVCLGKSFHCLSMRSDCFLSAILLRRFCVIGHRDQSPLKMMKEYFV